jgi:hypothetical protein
VTDLGPILDYAGPRKRSVLRLPAVSRLAVDVADGRVAVVESLAGQSQAMVALAFGLFVLAVVGLAGGDAAYDFRHHHLHRDWEEQVIVPAILAAALVATMIGVVQQTWRRTLLTAEHDELRLSFTSPLRRRHYRWTGAQVADVVLTLTANVDTGVPLGELLITRVSGGDVHLFTDHRAVELGPIAKGIHDALRSGTAEAIPAMALPTPPALPAEPDLLPRAAATAGRLLDVRRDLRQRQEGPE